MYRTSIATFADRVHRTVSRAVLDSRFHPSQRELLRATVERARRFSFGAGFAEPLGLLHLVASVSQRDVDEQMVEVGAFCFLYLAAADLLDDVQDDELGGTPHDRAGRAIAINSSLTLLLLALARLRRAAELESDVEIGRAYYRLFERISLSAVAGQHRDLSPEASASTPEEVLALHAEKTSSIGLFVECGALLSRCEPGRADRYRRIGEKLAPLLQIVDDLRDIYGKPTSPDLESGKLTYPLACFRETADAVALDCFRTLSSELPASLETIRRVLLESGAVERCAEKLDELRRDIHHDVAGLGNGCAAHRTLLRVVDSIVAPVYELEPVAETSELFRPQGGFHDAVRAELSAFVARMASFAPPSAPELEPWHLPQYVYEPKRRVIYYPDLDGMPEEVLPFQAFLLGTEDLEQARRALEAQLPAVLAHEFFHFWRDHAGRLTEDSWHEEFAANRLAVSYSKAFCPHVLDEALRLHQGVFDRLGHLVPEAGEAILSRCHEPLPERAGYDLDLPAMALVQLELIRRLAAPPADLAGDVARLLAPIVGAEARRASSAKLGHDAAGALVAE